MWDPANGQQIAVLDAQSPVTSLSFHNNGQLLSASADGSVKLWQIPGAAAKPLTHPAAVTSAVLSADGARLVTGCDDKQVRLWDLATGQAERSYKGHTLGVLCVAINAAGTQIAAGGADKTLMVWNTPTATEVLKFPLAAAVRSVAFSPDGRLLAGGLADNSIHLFDLAVGKEIKTLAGHTGAVNALIFTTKGDQLLSAGVDKTVQLWNIADGKSVKRLEQGSAVQALTLSKDGARLAAGGADKTAKVWTLADGKLQATITAPAVVHSVSFSPDGSRLLVGGADGKAGVYGLDGQLIESIAHQGAVNAVAFLGDGQRVVTAGADKTARLSSLSVVWQGRHAGPVRQAVLNARQDRVVSCGDDKTIKIWNAADGKLLRSLDAHDGPVTGVAVNADATRIVSGGADKTVKVWTLPAQGSEKLVVLALPAGVSAVALSSDAQRVAAAVSDGKSGRVHVFDAANGKQLAVFADHAGTTRSLAFLGNNRTLVSGGTDKMVRLPGPSSAAASLDAHAGSVTALAFAPDGVHALSAGADKTVKLWDMSKRQMVRTFGPLPEVARTVAFNRDGSVVGAAGGKTATVWKVTDTKAMWKLEHPAEVTGLSFSFNSFLLATAAADNKVHVWELASGQEVQAFLQGGPVRAVVCPVRDGTRVLSGGADKTVTLHTITINRIVPTGAAIRAMSVTPSASHVLTAGDDGKIKLWNTGNGANDRTLDGGGKAIHALAVSKNNALVAAGGVDQTVRIFTLADGKLLTQIKAPAAVESLSFASDNRTLAAACTAAEGGVIQTWNVVYNPGQPAPAEFGKPVQTYNNAGARAEVVFAGVGGTFYSGSTDKPIQIWKIATDTPRNLPHPNLVDAVAFNPAGTQLATGCHDGRVRIFDVAKGNVVREIQAHITNNQPAAVYCLAWTADGKQLVSGSYDRSLKLWNAADGKLIREFKGYEDKKFEKGHREGVVSVALAPDGKTLASAGGWDHTVKIWNVADGTVLRDLTDPKRKSPESHPGVVYGVRYTPDGKHLVSVGGAPQNKGFLAVWNAADGKLLSGEERPLGTLFALAVSPDGKFLAVGSGGSAGPGGEDKNNAYVMKLSIK